MADPPARIRGIITDGDLRRALQTSREGFFVLNARELMTPDPMTIRVESSVSAALEIMALHHVTLLVFVDGERGAACGCGAKVGAAPVQRAFL
ncbi:MAG: CBS domain-containing protein [Chromatiaceae bacterium]|nr:CBS domain-containing protein [Chromatiaceae bacterium]MCF7994295.1 CBS domain-containing protein [Chromatiaceae bacterium]MCF8003286.1 CBS domain-containing protein [Chromatiaceae bacterium]MCF8015548.1 CBS domain-containing protein [Chromatiaceae bacterium]